MESVPTHSRGVAMMIFKVPSHLNHSMILSVHFILEMTDFCLCRLQFAAKEME